jgi:uncharacterized secreted protein with C-terminal beta-propeller domain
MRKHIAWLALSFSLVAAGCSTQDARRSTFTSASLPYGGGRTADDAAGPAAASGGTPRTVEEADIIKSDNAGHLYAVNAYRGLEIIDVSNPDAPALVGRAPILGQPVDMYLENGLAYVIVSDYFSWWWDPQRGLNDFHGSQIKVVDVTTPSAPRIVTSFALDGFISDSRRVGDVIYAVSNLYSWLVDPMQQTGEDLTFVVSIDVADPKNVHIVDRLDFPGSSNLIHATSDSLYVAQPSWNNGGQTAQTNVQFVDISDPQGRMSLGASAAVPGYLDSKFEMDADAGVLRILTHDGGWGPSGSQRLSTWTVANGQFTQLGALDLPQSGGLFGVRFDGPRAYCATFVSRDPLEIIDVSDPTRPALTASLEIPGTLYQIVPRTDRLIALGSADGTWQGVAVSLFDVSDAARPSLLGQAPVAGQGSSAWTQAFWDDKALDVIDSLGLVTVPYQAWSPSLQRPEQGLRLVDFDRSGVTTRGLITQAGATQRALPVGSRLATLSELSFVTSDITDRDNPKTMGSIELVRNIIDFARVPTGGVQLLAPRDWWTDNESMRLRAVDMASVDDGSFLSELPLDGQSGRMFQSGSLLYVATQGWDMGTGQQHLRVSVVDASDLSHLRLRAALEVPLDANEWYYGFYGGFYGVGVTPDSGIALVDGTLLAFLGQRTVQVDANTWTTTQRLHVIDLGNPDAPAIAGVVDLGAQWAWGLIADGRTVYMTHSVTVAQPANAPPVVADYMDRVDLSDPQHPLQLASINIPGLLVAVAAGGSRIYTIDYQWSQQNPTNEFDTLTIANDLALLDQSLPIAEEISRVRVVGSDAYFTTTPWYWTWQPNVPYVATSTLRTVDVSDAANGNMREVSTRALLGSYTLRDVQAAHAFLETGGFWWWGPYAAGGGVAASGVAAPACLGCGWYGGGSDSLVVFDLADPEQPAFSSATRLNGWISSLLVDGGMVYLPSGYYGVQAVALVQ